MKEAITVRDLSYTYSDGVKALEDVSLAVNEGERIAIIGPNGAGKTTLLLHFNGILHDTGTDTGTGTCGEIEVFGKSVEKLRMEDIIRAVGIVFQDPDDQLFMPTIFDDIAFGLINLGLKEDEVRERVERTLLRFGLSGYEERCPHHLSYGEKKKVALAAVMSMEPRILVLDEPTANLDPRNRAELIATIKDLNEREGITVVTATHDVNAISELADRVYVLNRRIIAEGSVQKIFSDAELLKDSNLEVPEVFALFKVLQSFGYNCEELPLSINAAREEFEEMKKNNAFINSILKSARKLV
ncbi:MAG: ABC transporter ATP-binding protein [Methanophagales archaeon]|nr:ABC transporter ATP-binding protein [Methanophagales archaeon]